jgi:hypothetical protein
VTPAARLLPRRLLRYAARARSLARAHAAETSLRALNERVHGEHEIGVIGRFCDRAKLSIDVGAADGLYLHVMKKHSARGVAFEPNPMSFQRLEKSFPGTELEGCALSRAQGEAELRGRLRDRRAFNFATHQNPADVIRPGVYYNNFLFLADPRCHRELIEQS